MGEQTATDPVFRLRAIEEVFFAAARDVGVPRAEAEGLLHRAQRAIVFGESRETNPYVLAYEWLPVRTGYQARSRN